MSYHYVTSDGRLFQSGFKGLSRYLKTVDGTYYYFETYEDFLVGTKLFPRYIGGTVRQVQMTPRARKAA